MALKTDLSTYINAAGKMKVRITGSRDMCEMVMDDFHRLGRKAKERGLDVVIKGYALIQLLSDADTFCTVSLEVSGTAEATQELLRISAEI